MFTNGHSGWRLRSTCRSLAKTFLPVLLSTVFITGLSGCTYTIWNYAVAGEARRGETWSLQCYFGLQEISDSLSSVSCYIVFSETDTTKYPRLLFTVDGVEVNYSGVTKRLTPREEQWGSTGGEYVGATNVNHGVGFNPFDVSKPPPDTIIIDQNITILYRDSGEELTHFHHQTRAKLEGSRRWRFLEFMAGT